MNSAGWELVTHIVTAVGGGGAVALLGFAGQVASRKPKRLHDAEAMKLEAEAEEAQAGVRLRASEEWERLFTRLRTEIDRQDEELDKQAAQITSLRKEGHRLRNFATALEGAGRALMRYADQLEDMVRGQGGTPPPRPVMELPRFDGIA